MCHNMHEMMSIKFELLLKQSYLVMFQEMIVSWVGCPVFWLSVGWVGCLVVLWVGWFSGGLLGWLVVRIPVVCWVGWLSRFRCSVGWVGCPDSGGLLGGLVVQIPVVYWVCWLFRFRWSVGWVDCSDSGGLLGGLWGWLSEFRWSLGLVLWLSVGLVFQLMGCCF